MDVIASGINSICAETVARVVSSSPKKSGVSQALVNATKERISLRGLARIFGVSRKAITKWLNEAIQALPPFQSSVSESQPGDVLELDEVWSFVGNKQQKV